MILLKNEKQCPSCGRLNTLDHHTGHRCRECGTRVFGRNSTFNRMKEDWLLSFWVWFPLDSTLFKGWVHASHLDNPQPFVDPSHKFEKPDSSYGHRGSHLHNSSKYTPEQLGIDKIKPATT